MNTPLKPYAKPLNLNQHQQAVLRILVGAMIPPSEQFGVPGADDDVIFADILATGGAREAGVLAAITTLTNDARELTGEAFETLDLERQQRIIENFRDKNPDATSALADITVRCYYRDDRVMQAIGMEARPPFPQGYDVKQGDWSLLDPVRQRGKKIYRDV